MSMALPRRLPVRTLGAYAAPAFPLAILGLPLNVYLPSFWGETMGLGLTTVGLVLLATRLFDVVTDPLVGMLSDRSSGRFGRRRPWVAAALPIAAPAVWFLFVPPAGAGAVHLFVTASLVYLGWTMLNIAHTAWGAELSGDYHQRTRVNAWREAATLGGIVASALIPALAPGGIADDLRALAFVTLGLAIPALALLFAIVPDARHPARTAPFGLRATLAPLFANAPFRRLLSAWVLNGMANGLPAALFLLVVTHLLAAEDKAGPLLLAYFLAGIIAVPGWTRLAARIGKHRAWCAAMLWASLVFAFVPLLGPGDWMLFLVISTLSGAALGADLALPPAIQADVVDLDTLETGEGRAGLLFAVSSMAQKLGNALAVGLGLPLLEGLGFSSAGGEVRGLAALVGLYCAAPVVLKLAAVSLMWRFPLDAAAQAHLREQLEAAR
ncbi:MFS transporter [Elioraea sp.]|uniref:MFS transporter n=1 Tax=Elioraea sp. TaxID=2185103 RepID=UPI0025B98AF7|nr:MFS transporter [Elioraea sp.]